MQSHECECKTYGRPSGIGCSCTDTRPKPGMQRARLKYDCAIQSIAVGSEHASQGLESGWADKRVFIACWPRFRLSITNRTIRGPTSESQAVPSDTSVCLLNPVVLPERRLDACSTRCIPNHESLAINCLRMRFPDPNVWRSPCWPGGSLHRLTGASRTVGPWESPPIATLDWQGCLGIALAEGLQIRIMKGHARISFDNGTSVYTTRPRRGPTLAYQAGLNVAFTMSAGNGV
ncbi:uncharacterized protein LY79DRAFT_561337 [Colletotrichum navitas]|uniref:Uncharacterized protein n=1 Tax=Colletotrichum navitas TaxID=681940 RepID=A0AAD8V3A0_9PEZI|nr:uncharacterized protein LY79DRAFT_561337 [Colletotrichum navitas]KAK1580508.1 hypothetical protein LY79DRAFT_561337 [Colletotrichum navitas]